MTHTTICESTVKIKKKHIKSDHCQITHPTISVLNVINKKKSMSNIVNDSHNHLRVKV